MFIEMFDNNYLLLWQKLSCIVIFCIL